MCDIAYVLLLEEMQRQIDLAMLAAVMARANGADTRMPDPWQLRADFDRALAAEPDPADQARNDFRAAYGLR